MPLSVVYYGSRISDHITETPEGYLVCHDVPIARTGVQRYLGRETPDPKADPAREISVIRPEEEVFSAATVASFEGKPVTNDHPPEDVEAKNAAFYMKGVTKDVRRGTGNFKDCLVADLIIYDPLLVRAVKDGKREISCGYDCLWEPDGGRYIQRNIRGNHIAVVDRGRAGPRVSIHDSKPKGEKRMSKKSLLGKILAAFARDAEPEELAEASRILHDAEEPDLPPKKEEPDLPPKKEEGEPVHDDGDPIAALTAKVEALTREIAEMKQAHDATPPQEPDTLDALENELSHGEALPDQEKRVARPAGDIEDDLPPADPQGQQENALGARDAALSALRTFKPIVAGIADKAQRKAAADSLAALIRGQVRDAQYGAVLKASRQKQAAAPAADDARALGRAWMEKYNPHYKK